MDSVTTKLTQPFYTHCNILHVHRRWLTYKLLCLSSDLDLSICCMYVIHENKCFKIQTMSYFTSRPGPTDRG